MPTKKFTKRLPLFILLVVFGLSGAAPATASNLTKIAVASDGQTSTASVGSTAARSPFFLVFDGSGRFIEAVSNPHKEVRSGASTLVVNFLKQQGVTVFISQAFGGKMAGALKKQGIEPVKSEGRADDAVKRRLNSIGSR